MPRRKVTPEILEEMRRLRGEGLSYEKIARRLGLYPMTVYNHLRKREGQEDEDNPGDPREDDSPEKTGAHL